MLGHVDIQGAAAKDFVLPECTFMVGCLNCSHEEPVQVPVNIWVVTILHKSKSVLLAILCSTALLSHIYKKKKE